MTPEMLTPAKPESHIQRSIFILPGSSPFVNAMAVLPAPKMQRSHLLSTGRSPSTTKAWLIKNLL
jgi:hypothetical protein